MPVSAQTRAVINSLERLTLHNCGMRHEHAWLDPKGREIPQCADSLVEGRLGCAHSKNLTLRAAVRLAFELKMITSEDLDILYDFIFAVSENLFATDVEAQETSTLVGKQNTNALSDYDIERIKFHEKGILRGRTFGPDNLVIAFKEEQRENLLPLVALREVLMKCFEQLDSGLKIETSAIGEFIKKAKLFKDSKGIK